MKLTKKACGLVVTSMILCCSALPASAMPEAKHGKPAAFEEGDNTLGFALGLGNVYTYYGGVHYLPAFAVIFDHGIVSNVGPGTIGVGGIMGWQSSGYKYSNGQKAVWTNFIIGVRGTYHLTLLKDKDSKFDPYGGLSIGMRIESYKNEYSGINSGDYGGANPFIGPFVGVKYNLKPQFGVFSELGYDIAFFKIGLHVNF